jgi:hypothetical protein
VAQDYLQAAQWFRRGADAGVPEAQYNLARAYELGRGLMKDESAAQKWYRTAAAAGYARARYNLAIMLEEGRGSTADPFAAEEFYRSAAQQNYAPAQNNLGVLLAEGCDVPADLTQAYAWLAIAAENGARSTGRDLVAQQFTSAQLAEANIAVAKLRAQLACRAPPALATGTGPRAAAPVAPAVPPASPAGDESDLRARLAVAQADLAELLIEHARINGLARSFAREKNALEQQLAAVNESHADLSAKLSATTGPVRALAPTADFAAKLTRLQDALDDARTENARLAVAVESRARDRAAFDERLAAGAQLLERERAAFQVRLASVETRAVADRASAATMTLPDPAVEPLRAQVAQLTRDNTALRLAKEQAETQLAELTAQIAAVRATPAAALAAMTASGPGSTGADSRVAKLLADNARLNNEVRRSIIQLSAVNRQLRAAQEKATFVAGPLAADAPVVPKAREAAPGIAGPGDGAERP